MINHHPQFDIVHDCSFSIKPWKLSKCFGTIKQFRDVFFFAIETFTHDTPDVFFGVWWKDCSRSFRWQVLNSPRDKKANLCIAFRPVYVKFMTCLQNFSLKYLLEFHSQIPWSSCWLTRVMIRSPNLVKRNQRKSQATLGSHTLFLIRFMEQDRFVKPTFFIEIILDKSYEAHNHCKR